MMFKTMVPKNPLLLIFLAYALFVVSFAGPDSEDPESDGVTSIIAGNSTNAPSPPSDTESDVVGIDDRFLEVAGSIIELRKQYRSMDIELAVLKKLYEERQALRQMVRQRLYGNGNTWDVLHAMYGVSKLIVLPPESEDPLTTSFVKLGPVPVPVFVSSMSERIFEMQVTDQNMTAFFSSENQPPMSDEDKMAFNCTKSCLVNVSSFGQEMSSGNVWNKYCDCVEACNITGSVYYDFLVNLTIKTTQQLKEVYGKDLDKTPMRLKHCPINETAQLEKRALWLKWEEAMLNTEVFGTTEDSCLVTKTLIDTVFPATAKYCESPEQAKLAELLDRHYSGVVLALNTNGEMIARCPNIYS